MENYTIYHTVNEFLASKPIPGSLADVLGTVSTQVRGDTPGNGTLYLVGPGTFLRLNDSQSNAVLLESSDRGIPVAVKGLTRLVEDGCDLQVTEAYQIPQQAADVNVNGLPTLNLEDLKRLAIVEALRKNKGVQKDAAYDLDISPRIINYYLQTHLPDVWEALPRRCRRTRK